MTKELIDQILKDIGLEKIVVEPEGGGSETKAAECDE